MRSGISKAENLLEGLTASHKAMDSEWIRQRQEEYQQIISTIRKQQPSNSNISLLDYKGQIVFWAIGGQSEPENALFQLCLTYTDWETAQIFLEIIKKITPPANRLKRLGYSLVETFGYDQVHLASKLIQEIATRSIKDGFYGTESLIEGFVAGIQQDLKDNENDNSLKQIFTRLLGYSEGNLARIKAEQANGMPKNEKTSLLKEAALWYKSAAIRFSKLPTQKVPINMLMNMCKLIDVNKFLGQTEENDRYFETAYEWANEAKKIIGSLKPNPSRIDILNDKQKRGILARVFDAEGLAYKAQGNRESAKNCFDDLNTTALIQIKSTLR